LGLFQTGGFSFLPGFSEFFEKAAMPIFQQSYNFLYIFEELWANAEFLTPL